MWSTYYLNKSISQLNVNRQWKKEDLPRVRVVNNARGYFLVISVLYNGFLAELEAQPVVFLILGIKGTERTTIINLRTVVIDLNTNK